MRKRTVKLSVKDAQDQLAAAQEAEKVAQGWLPLGTAPKDGTHVHLWMEVYASPMSFGMADAFAVPDSWWDGSKWVHMFRGSPTELRSSYLTHWMPASNSLDGIEAHRG